MNRIHKKIDVQPPFVVQDFWAEDAAGLRHVLKVAYTRGEAIKTGRELIEGAGQLRRVVQVNGEPYVPEKPEAVMKHHVGRFYVRSEFTEGAFRGEGLNVFDRMIVIRAVQVPNRPATEYFAYHPDFEPVQEGDDIPVYVPQFGSNTAAPRWVKVETDGDAGKKTPG